MGPREDLPRVRTVRALDRARPEAAAGARLHALLVRLPRRERGAAHARSAARPADRVMAARPHGEPLRALYLQPASSFGGAERQAAQAMRLLPRHGVEVVPVVG